MMEALKGSSTTMSAPASITSTSTKRKKQDHNDAMEGIKSIVTVLAAKAQSDSQMMEAMRKREAAIEKREAHLAELTEKREARKEHLQLLKSNIFSPASAKTIKDSIIESLGFKKLKPNLTTTHNKDNNDDDDNDDNDSNNSSTESELLL